MKEKKEGGGEGRKVKNEKEGEGGGRGKEGEE